MCNSNVKSAGVAQIDGRPVLQPAGNRVAPPEGARPLKKSLHKSLSMPASFDNNAAAAACAAARPAPENTTRAAPAASLLPPATPASVTARATKAAAAAAAAEKSRAKGRKPGAVLPVVAFAALEAFEPAGSIAAAQREHAALAQAQRKLRIAHYGRTASFSRVEGRVGATATAEPAVPASPAGLDEKRCSFITPYSGRLHRLLVCRVNKP